MTCTTTSCYCTSGLSCCLSGVISDGLELKLHLDHDTDTYLWVRSDGVTFTGFAELDDAFDFINRPPKEG